jgi:hemerythrin
MPIIQWNEGLSVGFKAIDEQHMELIKRTNDFYDAMKEGKAREKLVDTINFLGSYVVEHFNNEQNMMKKYAYPDYAAHKALHDGFIREFEIITTEIKKSGPNANNLIRVQSKLVDWVRNHIMTVDTKLGPYLQGRNAAM